VLRKRSAQSARSSTEFIADLREVLTARVHEVTLLAPGIVELLVRSPMAARRFQAGQFFRLQALEQEAVAVRLQGEPIRRAMEGLALTGAGADANTGLVSLVVLEMGGSSDLCRTLRPGQEVSLMGPTGAPTEIVRSQTVVLAGGGLGNAVLLPIGKALRAAGCRVLYFAAYRQAIDVFHRPEIEAAADQVVWCCESDPVILPARPQDRAWRGNIVQAMQAWQEGVAFLETSGALEPVERTGRAARDISFHEANRLLVIGSDRMMAAVAKLRLESLRDSLGRPQVSAWASVNSPMQCMMKGVCGQCLQWLVDPSNGRRRAVLTCAEQDQPLDWIDFEHLEQRLSQNHLLEQQIRSLLHCTKPVVER
jgi:NAD(P)H-flavin reductase